MSKMFPPGTVVQVQSMPGTKVYLGTVVPSDPSKPWQCRDDTSAVRVPEDPDPNNIWLCMDSEILGVLELPADLSRTAVETWLEA